MGTDYTTAEHPQYMVSAQKKKSAHLHLYNPFICPEQNLV